MNRILKLASQRAMCVTVTVLALLSCAQAQVQNRVVETYPEVKGNPPRITALRVVEIRVAGNPVTLGQPFEADDDWLKNLSLKVKNVSGRTINVMPVSFGLSELLPPNGGDVAFTIMRGLYGDGSETREAADERRPIMPEEEIELTFTAKQLRIMQEIAKVKGITPTRIKLVPYAFITFEDGSRVSSSFSYPEQ